MDFNLLCCCPGLDFRRFLRSRRNQATARREARNCDENTRTPNGLKRSSASPSPSLIERESEQNDDNSTTQTHCMDHCDEHDRFQDQGGTDTQDKPVACENGEALLIATEDKELSASIIQDNDGQHHTGGECRAEAEAECSQEIQRLLQEQKNTELLSALPMCTVEEPDEEAETTGTGNASTTEFLPQLETETACPKNCMSEKNEDGQDAVNLPEAKAMNAVCGTTEANREQQLERLKYFAFTCMVDMCIIALILYVYYTLYLD